MNLDLTATARHTPDGGRTCDIGFARTTRSPNLHERYTGSSEAMMMGVAPAPVRAMGRSVSVGMSVSF
jgi:iron complex outermembrane recepter protein